MARAPSRTLRAQIRTSTATIVVIAVLLFAIPLAVVVSRLFESQALTVLQRDATRGVASVPDNVLEVGTNVKVPRTAHGTDLAVYDVRGRLVAGQGPSHSALAQLTGNGREHDGHDEGDLSVAVPVLSDTAVAGSVRAAIPLSVLRGRILVAWGLLAGLAFLVIAVATLLTRRAARRISEPFEQITAASTAMGAGRFDVSLPYFGIAEADAAGAALRESAASIDDLVRHERDFVAHASHQLRTPLAGLMLHLDTPNPNVPAALERARYLEITIADLLELRALSGAAYCDPGEVARDAVRRWHTLARPVVLRADETGDAGIAAPALRQALDVLIDNAIRHGAGQITITIEPHGAAVIVEVADQGDGFASQAQPGTGLTLTTGIVERAGGSLIVRRRSPQARVALILPPAAPPTADIEATEIPADQPISNR